MADDAGGPGGLGDVRIGSVIGGYRIDAVLGRGGMGVVYRATQLGLGRTVALKVIGPQFAHDPAFRERFRRESQLAASLDHPNVITIYEAGEDDGRLFVSMRHVDGVDLRLLVDTEGPVEPRRALAIIAQVGAALDAAHDQGLVHRDVKPGNILLERRAGSEHAYLSDFGLVKRIGTDPALTGSAGWVGSVDYIAPEQVQGRPVDGRTDIYALGAVLYTCLSGQVPFPRDDIAARLYACVNEPLTPLSTLRPPLPRQLDAVMARALAKDPASRHSSAQELVDGATRALEGGATWGDPAPPATLPLPPMAPPAPAPPAPLDPALLATGAARTPQPRRRRRALAGGLVAAVVVVGLLAATLAGAWSSGGNPRPSRGLLTGAGRAPVTSSSTLSGKGGGGAPGTGSAHGAVTVDDVNNSGSADEQLDRYRVTVYDVRRSGPYVILDFGIACTYSGSSPASPFGTCFSESAFAKQFDTNGPGGLNQTVNDVGGIQLVDPGQQKEYGEVTDAKMEPYSSALQPSMDVGRTVHLAWAVFPAPPPTSTSVDVILPAGGPQIPAVPITTGPARVPAAGSGVIPAGQAPFDRPPGSTDTTGLTLPVFDLVSAVGGPSGNDAEAPGRSTITVDSDVLFDFAKADLTPAAQGVLATLATRVKAGGHGTVTVTGYTDSVGDDSVNVPLSQARAQAVVTALTPLVAGAPVTFQTAGDGSASPVAPNTNPDGSDNPAGRALNRRVTVAYDVTNSPPPVSPVPAPPAPAAGPAGPQAAPAVDYTATDNSATSRYHVAVAGLVREGAFLVLHLTVTCTGTTDDATSPNYVPCDGETSFAGSNSVPPLLDNAPGAAGIAFNSPTAIYLSDPTTNQASVVVHDTQGEPLAARVASPSVGVSFPLWLYFPAPAPSVRAVTVVLPAAQTQIANAAITS